MIQETADIHYTLSRHHPDQPRNIDRPQPRPASGVVRLLGARELRGAQGSDMLPKEEADTNGACVAYDEGGVAGMVVAVLPCELEVRHQQALAAAPADAGLC